MTYEMADMDGKDLAVGDVVVFHSDRHPGLQRGCIIETRLKSGTCRVAHVGVTDRTLELVAVEDMYRQHSEYRGKHPSLLLELFPGKEYDYNV